MSGIETPFMYFVGAGLFFVVLHSYVGRQRVRKAFRYIVLVHQTGLIALSLWKFVGCQEWGLQSSWSGFRGAVLYGCVIGEAGSFVLEIKDRVNDVNN